MLASSRACVLSLFVLVTSLLTGPHMSTAEESLADAVATWVIEGLKPQDINKPYCQSGSQDYLGHIETSDANEWIDGPLAAMCRAKSNRYTGAPPPLVFACYTTPPSNTDFVHFTTAEKLCYCDYYLCDPELQQPFEDVVDFGVTLAELLG